MATNEIECALFGYDNAWPRYEVNSMITPGIDGLNGYKRYDAPTKGEYCLGLWQKRVVSGGSTLYFINFYQWRFPNSWKTTWSVEVRMYMHGGEFDLNLMVDDRTSEEVEAFYAAAYDRIGCIPDPHNQ